MNRVIRKILIIIIIAIMVSAATEYIIRTMINNTSNDKKKISTGNMINNKTRDWLNSSQGSQNEVKITQNYETKKDDGLSGYSESSVERQLYKDINQFLELINNKKYEEAYNLVHPEYRELYFPDINQFIEYCNQNYASQEGKTAEILETINVKDKIYLADVKILNKVSNSMGSETVSIEQDTLTVYLTNKEEDYKIAFEGFISFKPIEVSTDVGNIKLNFKSLTKYNDKVNILVEVSNGEKTEVTILDKAAFNPGENITLFSTTSSEEQGKSLYLDDNILRMNNYTIAPNSREEINLVFDVFYGWEIQRIKFNNIRVGNEVRTAEIVINE